MQRTQKTLIAIAIATSLLLHGVVVGFVWVVHTLISTSWIVWTPPKKPFSARKPVAIHPVLFVEAAVPALPPAEAPEEKRSPGKISLRKPEAPKDKTPAPPTPALQPETLPLVVPPTLLPENEQGVEIQAQLDVRALRRWPHLSRLRTLLDRFSDVKKLATGLRFSDTKSMLDFLFANATGLLINNTDSYDPTSSAFFVAYPVGQPAMQAWLKPPVHKATTQASPAVATNTFLPRDVVLPGFLAFSPRPTWKQELAAWDPASMQALRKTLLQSSELVYVRVRNPADHGVFHLGTKEYTVHAREIKISLSLRADVSFRVQLTFGDEEKLLFFVDRVIPTLQGRGDRLRWTALKWLFPEAMTTLETMHVQRQGKEVYCWGTVPSDTVDALLNQINLLLLVKNINDALLEQKPVAEELPTHAPVLPPIPQAPKAPGEGAPVPSPAPQPPQPAPDTVPEAVPPTPTPPPALDTTTSAVSPAPQPPLPPEPTLSP